MGNRYDLHGDLDSREAWIGEESGASKPPLKFIALRNPAFGRSPPKAGFCLCAHDTQPTGGLSLKNIFLNIMLSRRQLLLSGLGLGVASIPATWSYSHKEADSLSLERLKVPIRGLERPLRLAQLSDIHWDEGPTVRWSLIGEAIEQISAARVDLVVLTGDYVTFAPEPIAVLAPYLGQIPSRLGIYAVLGNHDNGTPNASRTITSAFKKANIEVLENTWTDIGGIALAGTGDFWTGPYEPERIFTALRNRTPTILLSHNPDSFWRLGEQRVDLQLSGHTHGGQVRLPLIGPLLAWRSRISHYLPELSRAIPRDQAITRSGSWEGEFWQGDNHLYVSRGLGRFRRLSIGCPPEVTIIDLVPKA